MHHTNTSAYLFFTPLHTISYKEGILYNNVQRYFLLRRKNQLHLTSLNTFISFYTFPLKTNPISSTSLDLIFAVRLREERKKTPSREKKFNKVLSIQIIPLPLHSLSENDNAGPFVYRLGRKIFILERGVRFPYGLQETAVSYNSYY